MNDRGWEELIDLIDQKYTIDKHHRQTQPLDDQANLTKEVEMVEFEKDNQKFRIERTVAPAVVDQKTYYHRTGGATRVEKIYDDSQLSRKVIFYKKSLQGEWDEIKPEKLLS